MREQNVPPFADWNPQFTPRWLSERLVGHVPKDFVGTIVDPACGAGNLLVAAATHLGAPSKSVRDIRLVGIDVSMRAVRACQSSLATLLPNDSFSIEHADFLARSAEVPLGPTAVVMNPPFKGYGRLGSHARKHISALLEMKGRFNLSHAFVQQAVAVFRPTQLVSLLPSNWFYSRGSAFRTELDSLKGSWDWEDVGGNAFRGLSVDVGILVWRPDRVARKGSMSVSASPKMTCGIEVRQGVATGRDALFIEVAKRAPRFGTVMKAVRGREVGRASSTPIWVPPESDAFVSAFVGHVEPTVLAGLKQRSCVASRRRGIYEYHESIPKWFVHGPKILVPEIITIPVRVELDARGAKLPLHSVIAIRVPSVGVGKAVQKFLSTARAQRILLTGAPRLAGGAGRLQVGAVRELLERWVSRRKKQAR